MNLVNISQKELNEIYCFGIFTNFDAKWRPTIDFNRRIQRNIHIVKKTKEFMSSSQAQPIFQNQFFKD